MKLWTKLSLVVVGIMAVVGVVGGAVLFKQIDAADHGQFDEFAYGTAEALAGTLRRSMLRAEPQELQATVERMVQGPALVALSVWNDQAKMAVSADLSQIGRTDEGTLVREALASGEVVEQWRESRGRKEFVLYYPVASSEECTRCHGATKRVLGVVEVGLDTTLANEHRRQQVLAVGGSALVGFLSVVIAIGLALQRLVVVRLSRLSHLASRVAAGDYSTRVQEAGGDEIAALAKDLNAMAQELGTRTEELLALKADLEERVRMREQEVKASAAFNMNVLNERVEALEQARRQEHRLTRLYQLLVVASRATTPEGCAREFLPLLQDEMRAEYASFTLVSPDGALGQRVDSFRRMSAIEVQAAPRGVTEHILKTGEAQYVAHAATDIRSNPGLLQAGIASYEGLPVKSEGRLAGILFVHSLRADAFKDDQEYLSAAADILGLLLTRGAVAS